MNKSLFLNLHWEESDNDLDTNKAVERGGYVDTHIADNSDRPSDADMQRIMYAAKMEYGRIQREKKKLGKRRGVE
jgi:hypothetical protein